MRRTDQRTLVGIIVQLPHVNWQWVANNWRRLCPLGVQDPDRVQRALQTAARSGRQPALVALVPDEGGGARGQAEMPVEIQDDIGMDDIRQQRPDRPPGDAPTLHCPIVLNGH